MVSHDLLITFTTAAETGSFSAASRVLGRRQSTVSANIAKLEDTLGITLFDRVGKYPSLTESGVHLYDSAKLFIESNERFTNTAALLLESHPVNLSIAIDKDLPFRAFSSLYRR